MKNLIGKKVYGFSGAGYGTQEGRITGLENNRWGSFWIVEWEDGSTEPFTKHTVKPLSQRRGIGVYYDENEPATKPEPEVDILSLEPTILQ